MVNNSLIRPYLWGGGRLTTAMTGTQGDTSNLQNYVATSQHLSEKPRNLKQITWLKVPKIDQKKQKVKAF